MKTKRWPAAAAAGALILEGLLRLAPVPARRRTDPAYERFLIQDSGPFFRPRILEGRFYYEQVPSVYQETPRQRVRAFKPAYARRIVVFGDGNADSLAAQMLNRAAPSGRAPVQVIGMGTAGASLEMLARRVSEIPRLKPDAVVVFVGKDLFLKTPEVHPWLLALEDAARHSRLLDLALGPPAVLEPDLYHDPRRRLAAFSRLLDSLTRRVRVPVVVLTVPSNLLFPPKADPAERGDDDYVRAVVLHDLGREDAAIRALSELVARQPAAWWSYTLGLWRLQDGRRAQARRALLAARDLDLRRSRATSALNDAIRASAGRGLLVLDAERVAEAASPDGIPGWDLFLNDQRLNDRGARLLADACLDLLGRGVMPAVRRLPDGLPPRESVAWDLHESTNGLFGLQPDVLPAATLLALRREVKEEEMRPLADGEGARDAAGLRVAFAEALWLRGERARARRLNEEALGPGLWRGEAALQRGRFLLRARRCSEARRALAAARYDREAGSRAEALLEALDARGACPEGEAAASRGPAEGS